ncbi:MAG: glycogen-binding domain-containing protein [Planctomycetes bacterium]|nr:glycogen-binding domain-containing protein [Planctomycetota bacterium]
MAWVSQHVVRMEVFTLVTTAAKSRKRVTFRFRGEPGGDVFVAGTFNQWDPTTHKLAWKNGAYTVSLSLQKGKHEYKFVVNGMWCVDPECPDWAPNGHGSLNSVITVA